MNDRRESETPTLFGHPTGLFTLFFAEMWERFSYYGMKALLVLYMVKGFLGLGDGNAYGVYGSWASLVYMTPFIGGMLADRLIGQRRAVLLGGIFMATGHLVLTFQNELAFYSALAFLVVGNGFFKPNISTMVGALYKKGSPQRDGGFTLFYMGINLGAGLAPLLCAYVGEYYGWHYGFGLATIGMLIGLTVFWAPTRLAQLLILFTASLTAVSMVWTQLSSHPVPLAIYAGMGLALVGSAVVAFRALDKGGLPKEIGNPPDREALMRPIFGIRAEFLVYGGALLSVPVIAWMIHGAMRKSWIAALGDMGQPAGLVLLLVGLIAVGYIVKTLGSLDKVAREKLAVAMILTFFSLLFWSFYEQTGSSLTTFTDRNVDRVLEERSVTGDMVGQEVELVLTQEQFGYLIPSVAAVYEGLAGRVASLLEAGTITKDGEKERLEFDLRPGDFLEAAGGSTVAVECFSWLWDEKSVRSDAEERQFADLDHVQSIRLALPSRKREGEEFWAKDSRSQARELLGSNLFTLEKLKSARDRVLGRYAVAKKFPPDLDEAKLIVLIDSSHVGMGIARAKQEIPASTFQAVNPIFIILYGLVFTALWALLAARGREPSTPFKFALGLLQLGVGYYIVHIGIQSADHRGMIGVGWLILMYMLHTTGELCLSPVGLSMVTRLSPVKLVSTMMGVWFLAMSFSQQVAAGIAKMTGIREGRTMPIPSETLHIYGGVFEGIGYVAMGCAVVCFLLVPLLKKWMHDEANPSAMH